MLKTTIIASIVAILAFVATHYTWDRNKAVSLIAACVGLVASAVAVIVAFVGAVVITFKIIPVLILLAAAYILYRRFVAKN